MRSAPLASPLAAAEQWAGGQVWNSPGCVDASCFQGSLLRGVGGGEHFQFESWAVLLVGSRKVV